MEPGKKKAGKDKEPGWWLVLLENLRSHLTGEKTPRPEDALGLTVSAAGLPRGRWLGMTRPSARQSGKFLPIKLDCVTPTKRRQKDKSQLPTFIYN